MNTGAAIPASVRFGSSRIRRGFTLIELLVCISIIVVLTALLLPCLSVVRFQGRLAACSSNLRNVAAACFSYAGENDERIDMRAGISHYGNGGTYSARLLAGGYIDAKKILACPDAVSTPGMSLARWDDQFGSSSLTAGVSYYGHFNSFQQPLGPDDGVAPCGPIGAGTWDDKGWIRSMGQATPKDAMLCEWSKVLAAGQENSPGSTHGNHWRGGKPSKLHIAWFDGSVSRAANDGSDREVRIFYEYWVVGPYAVR